MLLTADVGGTKTNIALFESAGRGVRPRCLERASFSSVGHPGMGDMVEAFLEKTATRRGDLKGACFAVAGPILDGRAEIPNLPWTIDARELEGRFGFARLSLINDLEATAESIIALEPDELESLNAGELPVGPPAAGAVIAAGTGLGMAVLGTQQGEWIPHASEGGHADFAPRNEQEIRLLAHLLGRFERVSTERVVSGPGLVNLYGYFTAELECDAGTATNIAEQPAEAAAVISQAALDRKCPACVAALDQFVVCYGAATGNLALTALATGGVFIGGGIAPKILTKLRDGEFLRAFRAKGRLGSLLDRVAVRVILNQEAALYGAARRARRDLASS